MKYTVVIPDLTLKEAVEMIETAGDGEVIFSDENGLPIGARPDHSRRQFLSATAYPRQNAATIKSQ